MIVSRVLGTPGFEPLRYRDFRVLSAAGVLGTFSAIGETVVLGWLVLELTDSPLMVGVAFGLHMLPNALLGVVAGAVADMVDRRRFMRLVYLAQAVPTGALGLLIVVDSAALWHVLVVAFITGCLRVFGHTAKTSFAYDVVGPALAVQGLAIMSMASRLGAMSGSISLGLISARLGLGPAYLTIAAVYLLTAATLLAVRSRGQAAPRYIGPAWIAIKELFGELRRNPVLSVLLATTAAVEVLGFSHIVLLPSLARDVLNVGVGGLGFMNGVGALGGIVGIVALSARGRWGNNGLLYLAALALLGISVTSLGVAPGYVAVLGVLAVANSAMAVSDVLSQGLMQLSVPNELRGRAVGTWMLAIGTSPVGTLQIGALASLGGVGLALAFNGVGLVVLALAVGAFVPRVRRI